MKKYCLLLACTLSCILLQAQNIPTANEVLQTAYQKARQENKNVFLLFHASWCGWCRDMDSAMRDASVKTYFEKNYVITHLTVYERENKKQLENPGALEFLTAHNGADKGIPFWMILDPNGNVLADSRIKPEVNTGRPATTEEVAHFISVLEKTSTLSPEQKLAVKNRFYLKE
jgi:thioredoxin-related protein